jgi:hypothetical protein
MTTAISDNGITHGTTASEVGLQPIAATVTSNAITVTLNPTTVVFRHTSPTNGTPVPIQNAAQLSLTIAATDSFGAVTADGTRRIAILAINNAGVMELAATSLAGGLNLDETGVITTAATATTLTAIKALGVRTGVTYKVVGFIDVPFTTAVGWGALVTVQGYGGNALSCLGSLGYGQGYGTNLNATKVIGVTYYNTKGRPIGITVTGSGGGSANSLVVNGTTIATSGVSGLGTGYPSFFAVLPVGASYSVTGSASPSYWFELS